MGRRDKRSKGEKGKKGKIIAIVLIILLLLGVAGFAYWYFVIRNGEPVSLEEIKEEIIPVKESNIKIFSGNDRPIAVMIDNHKGAWPQAGLKKAYAVYEIIVEGGETRLMAVFKGQDVSQVGPIRSSRHYYLDYALENDAIYTHYGWSPKAESDIKSLKINNINGISESTSVFKRIKQKAAPHNVMASTTDIKKIAEEKKYKTTSNEKSVLNYVEEEVELEGGIAANTVTIPYSTLHTTSYKYDATNKVYIRYARGTKQTDFESKEDITTKNIIITFVKNSKLNDGENKDRQDLDNIGTFKGYYITNGKAIEITCEKASRSAKTVYKDSTGKVIDVNDGNTFFNICPIDANVTFE